MNHYLLTKREGFNAGGRMISARQCATALLDVGVWPLWEHTRNRAAIRAGDQVAIYLAGDGSSQIMATAEVLKVGQWDRKMAATYPLMLDGTPVSVLHLHGVNVLEKSIPVRQCLNDLSFIRKGVVKWGVAFMGGCRALTQRDFAVLTSIN